MIGIVFLLVVIAISSLPLIPAWFYFRKRNIKAVMFLLCLGSGIVSVFIALVTQNLIPVSVNSNLGFILSIFLRIALLEEICRMVVLFPLLNFAKPRNNTGEPISMEAWSGTAGLIAGLGFAAAESVFYTTIDPGIALLRAVSTAPLHGACGARIGGSIYSARTRRFHALILFVMAVLIHGMYDLFILSPALPSILSPLIAFAALGSSLLSIRHTENDVLMD